MVFRAEPPVTGSEREMLVGWLDFHRETLAMKCDSLTSEQLSLRPLGFTALSLAGLLRHLAEVERTYFTRVFAGEELDEIAFEDDPFREQPATDYSAAPDEDGAAALSGWRAAVGRSRLVIDHAESLTDTGSSGLPMRFWLVKTLNEYARHNGHADLLREAIDGAVGD